MTNLPVAPVALFSLGDLALTDSLHDLEGLRFIKSLLNQVDHDIVSTTDTCIDGSLPLLNKSLGIAKPNVRTMGKT